MAARTSQERVALGHVSFQPLIDLASRREIGAEAVERNRHDCASRREYARDEWILRYACAVAAEWGAGCVAVNISAAQLQGGNLLRQVGAALERSGLAAERLELELAEPILAEIDLDTLLALSVIRDLGAGIVLDEFGTGHASLRMLKRLPLSGLKLDVSLVREVPHNLEDAAIARAVIGAARALGLSVAANGIEHEAQCAALAAFGCDTGQGPLFADASRLAGLATRRR